MTQFGAKVGLSIVVTITLFLAELIVSVVFPQYSVHRQLKFIRADDGTEIGPPSTTVRQVKNTGDYNVTVHFNAAGFRDRKEFSSSNADDWFVIVDSFAMGWGSRGRRTLQQRS